VARRLSVLRPATGIRLPVPESLSEGSVLFSEFFCSYRKQRHQGKPSRVIYQRVLLPRHATGFQTRCAVIVSHSITSCLFSSSACTPSVFSSEWKYCEANIHNTPVLCGKIMPVSPVAGAARTFSVAFTSLLWLNSCLSRYLCLTRSKPIPNTRCYLF
jgi:hypothetical protein